MGRIVSIIFGLSIGGESRTIILTSEMAEAKLASLHFTFKEYVPAAEGFPERTPLPAR